MNRRGAVRAALLLVVAVLTALVVPAAGTAATNPPEPPLPSAPVTINEFIGENEDFFEDCVGTSVERPGCGSEARGGWRQGAIFAAVVAGMGVVFWRVAVGVRHNRAKQPPAAAG